MIERCRRAEGRISEVLSRDGHGQCRTGARQLTGSDTASVFMPFEIIGQQRPPRVVELKTRPAEPPVARGRPTHGAMAEDGQSSSARLDPKSERCSRPGSMQMGTTQVSALMTLARCVACSFDVDARRLRLARRGGQLHHLPPHRQHGPHTDGPQSQQPFVPALHRPSPGHARARFYSPRYVATRALLRPTSWLMAQSTNLSPRRCRSVAGVRGIAAAPPRVRGAHPRGGGRAPGSEGAAAAGAAGTGRAGAAAER